MKTFPFGKHKGQPLSDIPTEYLNWALGLENLRDHTRKDIQEELAQRPDDEGGEQREAPQRQTPPKNEQVAASLRIILAEVNQLMRLLEVR